MYRETYFFQDNNNKKSLKINKKHQKNKPITYQKNKILKNKNKITQYLIKINY